MRALFLPHPTPSEVSSHLGDDDDDYDDDDEEDDDDDYSQDADGSIGSISFSASSLQKHPKISLSYRRDPDAVKRILSEERQDEGEADYGGCERDDAKGAEREESPTELQSLPLWTIPSAWNNWIFPSTFDDAKLVLSNDDDAYCEEETQRDRKPAYNDAAWTKRRAEEAMAQHQRISRPSGTISGAVGSEDPIACSSIPHDGPTWRNRDNPYTDWQVVVERVPSGLVDSYKIDNRRYRASLRLTKEFEERRVRQESPESLMTQLVLQDNVADCVPEVLRWMYQHSSNEGDATAPRFDAEKFVSLMVLADELDIPSLRDHLTEQYQRNVTVEDLTSIWGTWIQTKREAERAVAVVADRMTSLVTRKIVEVMQMGCDAEMDRLVDELAPVADPDLIMQVMTSEALMETESHGNTKSREGSRRRSAQRGWRNPPRLRFSESNLRLGRFVARFCRTHDSDAASTCAVASETAPPPAIPLPSNETALFVRGTRETSGGWTVALGLMEQVAKKWTEKFKSLPFFHTTSNKSSRDSVQQTGQDCSDGAIRQQVQWLCQRQRKLLEMSLQVSSDLALGGASEHLFSRCWGIGRGSSAASNVAGYRHHRIRNEESGSSPETATASEQALLGQNASASRIEAEAYAL